MSDLHIVMRFKQKLDEKYLISTYKSVFVCVYFGVNFFLRLIIRDNVSLNKSN